MASHNSDDEIENKARTDARLEEMKRAEIIGHWRMEYRQAAQEHDLKKETEAIHELIRLIPVTLVHHARRIYYEYVPETHRFYRLSPDSHRIEEIKFDRKEDVSSYVFEGRYEEALKRRTRMNETGPVATQKQELAHGGQSRRVHYSLGHRRAQMYGVDMNDERKGY